MPRSWKRHGPGLAAAMAAGIWTALTGGLAYRLARPPAAAVSRAPVVGRLAVVGGDVKLRPGGTLIWAPAAAGAMLHDGDMIATGDLADATLVLPGQHRIDVGPNSIVELGAGHPGRDETHGLELALLKGHLAASQAGVEALSLRAALRRLGFTPALPAGVEIQTGDKTYQLPAGTDARLTLSRRDAAAAALVTDVAGGVTQAEAGGAPSPLTAADLAPAPGEPGVALTDAGAAAAGGARGGAAGPAEAAAPEAAGEGEGRRMPGALVGLAPLDFALPARPRPPADEAPGSAPPRAVPQRLPPARHVGPLAAKRLEPPPVPPPPALPPPPDLSPRVAADQPRVLFTPAKLRLGCVLPDLPVVVTPPAVQTPPEWTPFVDVTMPGGPGRKLRVYGHAGAERQTLGLPMQEICGWLAAEPRLDVQLSVRPGARLAGGEVMLAPHPVRLAAASLAAFPDLPVTVHFARFALPARPGLGWLPASTDRRGMALRITGRSLPKLLPLLVANGYVSLSDLPISGAYPARAQFVAFGRLVATLGLAKPERPVITALADQLGADVAFVGDPTAFVQLPPGRIDRLNVLEGLLDAHGKLRLVTHDRIVLVEEDDLESAAESLKALTYSADLAFTKDVDIVVPRTPTAH